jgi:hypothetical protein
MNESALARDLDRQIATTHRRFVKAMDGRVPDMPVDSKERYFGVLSLLVAKLESTDKTLRQVMHEMLTEAAHVILQEMQG